MSNHHEVNSLAASFVQMAKAFEDLPQVQHELRHTQSELQKAQDTIQRLELKLMDRHNQIDSLRSDVRKAEADRDDAELRFLEADERTTKALAFIKEQFGSAGSLIQALEPPKVVVKAETEPFNPGQSAGDPTTSVSTSDQQASVSSSATIDATSAKPEPQEERHYASANPSVDPFHPPQAEGQSANPLPDASSTVDHSASMPNGQTSLSEPVQKADTATTEQSFGATTSSTPLSQETTPEGKSDAPFTASTPQAAPYSATSPVLESASSENGTPEQKLSGPYVGIRYYDWPNYVNLANWLAGGGSEENYNWRPSVSAI